MRCNSCGSQIPEGSYICNQCGRPIEGKEIRRDTTSSLPVVETESGEEIEIVLAPEAIVSGEAILVIKKGPEAGARFTINKPVTTAGRHPESDIFLDDITVSRRHLEIRRIDDQFEIVDVGSLNGTYVNKERIDRSILKNGDEIQIGKFKMIFFMGSKRRQ